MDRFIARENIKRYRQMLAVESDEDRRRTLGELLARAEEDLAALVLTAGGINLLLWRARAGSAHPS